MDPRVARTRRSLQDSLLALARELPLDDITIGDIAEHAGVNRSSFYQHYRDKETLLADALEDAVAEVAARLNAADAATDRAAATMPPELEAYLAHIDDNATLYRRILGDHGSALVAARLRDRIEAIVVDALAAAGTSAFGDLPVDVIAAGVAGSALGVITAWVQREPRPPVSVAAAWLWRVLLGPDAERRGG